MKFGTGIMRLITTILCGLMITGPTVLGELLNASVIPVQERTYDIDKNFCRLLAHGSLLLKDSETGSLRIVVDGGMAKYRVRWEGREFEVPDLNKHTAIIELGKDFTIEAIPITIKQKPLNVPVLNRGIIWTDATTGNIYIAGGHFFKQAYWDASEFYVPDDQIPDFSIWKYDLKADSWEEITPIGEDMTRLISSAYTSIPTMDRSFAFGGYYSPRSDPDNAPPDTSMATNGMVIFDHKTREIFNVTDPDDRSGYTHGALHRIIPANDSGDAGMLLNLMALQGPLNTNFTENDKDGPMRPNDFTQIRFFDLETNRFITQKASFMDNQKPETRTRFCSVLVKDEDSNTWDLWVYGGQKAEDPEKGANDIWVLTMPSFMWIKIPNTFDNIEVRGHTCHAVGNQLLVLGGYPPSFRVDPNEECETRLMRIFDMTEKSWKSHFKTDTTYIQPEEVRRVKDTRTPFHGWGDPRIQELFAIPSPITIGGPPTDTGNSEDEKDKSGLSKTAIIIIVVLGIIIVLGIVAAVVYFKLIRPAKKAKKAQSGGDIITETTIKQPHGPGDGYNYPPPPVSGPSYPGSAWSGSRHDPFDNPSTMLHSPEERLSYPMQKPHYPTQAPTSAGATMHWSREQFSGHDIRSAMDTPTPVPDISGSSREERVERNEKRPMTSVSMDELR